MVGRPGARRHTTRAGHRPPSRRPPESRGAAPAVIPLAVIERGAEEALAREAAGERVGQERLAAEVVGIGQQRQLRPEEAYEVGCWDRLAGEAGAAVPLSLERPGDRILGDEGD